MNEVKYNYNLILTGLYTYLLSAGTIFSTSQLHFCIPNLIMLNDPFISAFNL